MPRVIRAVIEQHAIEAASVWVLRDLGVAAANYRPAAGRIGVSAAAMRRLVPGPILSKALTDKDPSVVARGARAVGEFNATGFAPMLRSHLSSQELPVRFWAAWSLALVGGDSSA